MTRKATGKADKGYDTISEYITGAVSQVTRLVRLLDRICGVHVGESSVKASVAIPIARASKSRTAKN